MCANSEMSNHLILKLWIHHLLKNYTNIGQVDGWLEISFKNRTEYIFAYSSPTSSQKLPKDLFKAH